MKNKTFTLVLILAIIGFSSIVVVAKTKQQPEPPRPGVEHSDKGRGHVSKHQYGGGQTPTSGPHADPVVWGVYQVEIRDDQALHNLEHGGIYVSYSPDLPKADVAKLTRLLSAPFSDSNFQPKKVVLAPRVANTSPIELSSWRRSEVLTNYDQSRVESYIRSNLGNSPEPRAQ